MSTKPYTCGSNYVLKMSNYKKGPWCEVLDGLYWRFTEKHRGFYESNPRLSILSRSLDKMDPERKERIFGLADDFIKKNSLWNIKKKKFVRYVKNHLPGEKNGKRIGQVSFTVAKDVAETKTQLNKLRVFTY